MKVSFGGTDYDLQFQQYGNGRPAIVLVGSDGECAAVATVNVPEAPLLPNQVLIKDYSENEGMLAALEQAGLVKPLGVSVRSGHVSMPLCQLLVDPSQQERATERPADVGLSLSNLRTTREPGQPPQDQQRQSKPRDRGNGMER